MWRFSFAISIVFLLSLSCGRRNAPSMPKPPPIVDGSVIDQMLAEHKAARRDSLLAAKVRLVAMIRRTGCYGHCPVYIAQVFSNDSVSYLGVRHVAREGLYEAKADTAWTNAIVTKAKAIHYFELKDAYPAQEQWIESLPSIITTVHLDGEKKMIHHNHDAPKQLIAFEQFFESQLQKLRWMPVYH